MVRFKILRAIDDTQIFPSFALDRGLQQPGPLLGDIGFGFHNHALTAVFLPPGNDLLCQAILPPVGLVHHDDDIPPPGQCRAAFLKLLHGGKDDVVGLTACQQLSQMLTALRVLGRLPQEVLAPDKLAVELIIEVVSVGDDDDGRAFQGLLQTVGVENHGQRHPTALRMPENAALAVGLRRTPGGRDGLFDGEILMIPGQNFERVLSVHIETDKVFEDVEETLLLEQSLKKDIKIDKLRVSIVAVCCFPLHVLFLPEVDIHTCTGSTSRV